MVPHFLQVPSSDVLSDLFESLPLGVVAMTPDTRVVVFNAHEEKLAGRRRERVLGRHFFEEIAPCMNVRELAGKFKKRVEDATLDETIEFSFPFPNVSQPRDVIVRMRSFIAGGQPHGMLLIEDVSMQRALERMRETLANLLVHDMKSPLTNVIGNLEFILNGIDGLKHNEPYAAAATDGLAGAHRLNRMILDLLDITRLETGVFPIKRSRTSIARVLQEAVAGVSAPARNRSVTIESTISLGLDADVDPDILRRVFDNLLDNAVRHSPSNGRVVVSAHVSGRSAAIDVTDDGSGIPRELRQRIFEKFAQSDRSGHRPSNHGLGLTFVRMAVRAHGGEVSVIDDGRSLGTTFRVILPLETAGSDLG